MKSDFIIFACPQCRSIYEKNSVGELKKRGHNDTLNSYSVIAIGQSGTLNGEACTVIGVMIKKAYTSHYWAEYILEDAVGGNVYLSESEGHWILLKKIPDSYDVDRHPRTLQYEDQVMNLYDYTDTELVLAKGFFNFELPKKKIHLVEYIQPPHIISIEKADGEETTYYGEHIPAKAIAKAFPLYSMPVKSGVGVVQPFSIDVRKMAIIFSSIAVLIFTSHWIIYSGQTEQQVLSKQLPFSEFDAKEFISPSFELKGGSAPLTVQVHSEVDNSWANVQVALVNEQTSEEVYASKDVEYYHGYTDGEHWTEGSRGDNFNICGVDSGKYHLVLTPQKAPEDLSNSAVSVNVTWNQPSMRNAWFMVIAMGIIAAGMYFLRVHYEQKRWSDSDFSPFGNDN
jgi:hypothetical protein